MLRLTYLVAIIAGSVLAVAVAYIAWANRSARLGAGSLLAVFAVIITLAFIPRSKTIRDQFTVSVVLSRATNLPLLSYYSRFGVTRMSSWVFPLLSEDDPDRSTPEVRGVRPRVVHFNSDDERSAFYREWLQYCVLRDTAAIVGALSLVEATTSNRGGQVTRAISLTPPETSRSYVLRGSDIANELSVFHFLREDERNMLVQTPIKLPLDTSIKLTQDTIILERSDYFTIRLSIETLSFAPGPPALLDNVITEPGVLTIYMAVRMDGSFEGLVAENPDVVEVKGWIKKVFDRLKQDLADPS